MDRRKSVAGGGGLLTAMVVASLVVAAATVVRASDVVGSRVDIPDSMLDRVFPAYVFHDVSQEEAEALLASAVAAIYYPNRGEIRLLADDSLQTAYELLARREVDSGGKWIFDLGSGAGALDEKRQLTGSTSLRGFLEPSIGVAGLGAEIETDPYVIKAPAFRSRETMPPVPENPKRLQPSSVTKDYISSYEDFEGDVWSFWDRSDNTNGQYTWGVRSCDAHWSTYSGDAGRGGSLGGSLGCSTPYPRNFEAFMFTESCESIPSNWKAFMELQVSLGVDQDGSDEFLVAFEDTHGDYVGWAFWGTTSDWYELVFNLRQWLELGDLGNNDCNTLALGFSSDNLSNSGFGARVDDVYLYFGDTVGSYECAIAADPASGPAPLTVSFRAMTDIYSPTPYWRFDDGETSGELDPSHVFTSQGTYDVRLRVSDDWGSTCYSAKRIVVSQGSCSYQISPTSGTYNHTGGTGTITVTTTAGCPWTATSNVGWVSITSGASGSGSGSVHYSVSANSTPNQRTGTISAAGRTFTVTQSGAPSCTYSISPTSRSFDQSGGTGTVSVSTTAGCTWTAVSNNGWIHVTSGASGTGSGNVGYRVDANSGGARTGTMTIAGHTFTVSQAGGGGGETYTYQVAGIAHAGGAGGSVWRSTLCVTNRSGSSANLTLAYRMGSNTVTRSHTIQNNWIKEWADVAVSLFNQSANTSGAIEITSDAPVMVVARTYNEAPDGTFGQGMPGNDDLQTLASGQLGVLPQLKKSSAFRTNVGLMNHGTAACNVRIKLFSETGSQLGSMIDTSVPAKQWKQINDVFAEAGVGGCAIGYATIEVRTAGGKIWAYGSVVDNGTGDPTTIQLFIE